MNYQDMTDEELQDLLRKHDRIVRDNKEVCRLIINELLKRKRAELNDGYYTDFGFVPNHDP